MIKIFFLFWTTLIFNIATTFLAVAQENSFEAEIRAFEKQDSVKMPQKGQTLLFGSSSFRLWDNWKEDLSGYQVFNRGFGGSQMSDALYFFDRMVVPYQPKIILLYEGDNDINAGKTPNEVFNGFVEFAQKVKTKLPKAKLYFVAIKPSPSRLKLIEKQKEANKLIQNYCQKNKAFLGFIDIFSPMLKKGVPQMEHFKEDSLHLNQKGYDIWKKIIRAALK